jgi:hypothetical protein
MAACTDNRSSPTAGQISGLELEMISPPATALGTPGSPVATQHVIFNVTARQESGQVYSDNLDADVFISFGGVKTGTETACGVDASGVKPISTIHLIAGRALAQEIDLPQAFGATSIWLEENRSHATGASPTIYFRNPLITDVQTPPDMNAANATFCTPFDRKFVVVDQATGSGKLVVTSVFIDSFAITDTGASSFNSIYIYAFGKPPSYIVPGRVVQSFSGNVSKFVGFTELNFPLFTADADTALEPLPAPTVLQQSWLTMRDELSPLAAAAGPVVFTAPICDPDPPNPTNDINIQKTKDSWRKYNQFVLNGDGTCSALSNFAAELPAKTLGSFDPLANVGKTVTVTGMLRNNSGQNPILDINGMAISCDDHTQCLTGTCVQGQCKKGVFNFWTIDPRTPADVVIQ